ALRLAEGEVRGVLERTAAELLAVRDGHRDGDRGGPVAGDVTRTRDAVPGRVAVEGRRRDVDDVERRRDVVGHGDRPARLERVGDGDRVGEGVTRSDRAFDVRDVRDRDLALGRNAVVLPGRLSVGVPVLRRDPGPVPVCVERRDDVVVVVLVAARDIAGGGDARRDLLVATVPGRMTDPDVAAALGATIDVDACARRVAVTDLLADADVRGVLDRLAAELVAIGDGHRYGHRRRATTGHVAGARHAVAGGLTAQIRGGRARHLERGRHAVGHGDGPAGLERVRDGDRVGEGVAGADRSVDVRDLRDRDVALVAS